MKKIGNNKVRITLDEARKIKGRSNPSQIIGEQKIEQAKEEVKKK